MARAGRPVGRVRVRRGTVWSAEADGLTGDDAVRAVPRRGLEVDVRTLVDLDGPRDVDGELHVLLMAACALAPPTPAPEAVPEPTPEPERSPAPDPDAVSPDARFDAAMEAGLDALLARDFWLAWRAFSDADAIKPGSPVVRANLERIRQLGHPRGSRRS